MKAYTDLNQSKKLSEILPLESADMYYHYNTSVVKNYHEDIPNVIQLDNHFAFFNDDIPCWSLAALLNYLREIDFFPNIEADEHGVTMSVCYYDDEEGELLHPMHNITTEEDNFVDACYEMIILLHTKHLL